MSDFLNLYPNGLPIHNPQWNVPQPTNCEPQWLARLVELEAERDAAVKRAEVAEAALAAVPVDAIGIYYQWSDFLGWGDIGAEVAHVAFNTWLDQQPGWSATARA